MRHNLVNCTLAAQVDRRIIVGAVTEPSGAAVPGATVVVTDRATGVVVSSPTNADGQYQVINLTPSEYRVMAPINIGGLQRLGSSPWRPQFQVAQVWQGLDSLSLLRGTHSFQLGYEYHRIGDNFLDIEAPQSQLFANGSFTNQNGFGAADFLLGNIDGVQFVTPLVVHNYMPGHAVYGQDAWRATLTLIDGLRYERFAPVLNRQTQTANFTPANGGGLLTASSNQMDAVSIGNCHV